MRDESASLRRSLRNYPWVRSKDVSPGDPAVDMHSIQEVGMGVTNTIGCV